MYIVVAGGGMVGGMLVKRLLENKHDVVLIESDKNICDKLYAETGVVAVNGSCTRIEVLNDAEVGKADIAVVTTPDDADNLACAILAKSMGVPQVIVRMRDPNYEKAYKVAGVNRIVRVTDLMVNQMLIEIEHPKVRRITAIGGGRANIFMVVVPESGQIVGKTIEQIARSDELNSECTFVALYNQESDKLLLPRGGQVVNQGDELYVISAAEDIKKVTRYLTARSNE